MNLRKLYITLVMSVFSTLLMANEKLGSKTVYTMVKSDYQIIVDYVNTNLTNTQKYAATAEDHFGASAYYSNFNGKSGEYDESFVNSDSAILEALTTVFLPAKYPSVSVNDTFKINYKVYTGSTSNKSMTFVCTAEAPLAFVMIEVEEVVVVVPPTDFEDLSFGTDTTFDVMTWNIEHFPKNGEVTMAKVKEVLTALQPEVVAFQEIDDTAKFRKMINGLEDYEPIIGDYGYAPMCFAYKSESVTVNSTDQLFKDDWSSFPREPFVLDLSFRGEDFIVISNHLKCCGDGTLDKSKSDDEENRRFNAIKTLKTHIDATWEDQNVIVVGDFNDELEDEEENNIFMPFITDSLNYVFADIRFSYGNSEDFSYPSWPSDLDHILITNELFERSTTQVIKVDDIIGWSVYDTDLSDHRPVGLRVVMEKDTHSTDMKINTLKNISISPNPVDDIFNIEGLSTQANSIITLYNNDGQELAYLTSQGKMALSVNLISYSSGIYFLHVQEDTQQFCTKVVKR